MRRLIVPFLSSLAIAIPLDRASTFSEAEAGLSWAVSSLQSAINAAYLTQSFNGPALDVDERTDHCRARTRTLELRGKDLEGGQNYCKWLEQEHLKDVRTPVKKEEADPEKRPAVVRKVFRVDDFACPLNALREFGLSGYDCQYYTKLSKRTCLGETTLPALSAARKYCESLPDGWPGVTSPSFVPLPSEYYRAIPARVAPDPKPPAPTPSREATPSPKPVPAGKSPEPKSDITGLKKTPDGGRVGGVKADVRSIGKDEELAKERDDVLRLLKR